MKKDLIINIVFSVTLMVFSILCFYYYTFSPLLALGLDTRLKAGGRLFLLAGGGTFLFYHYYYNQTLLVYCQLWVKNRSNTLKGLSYIKICQREKKFLADKDFVFILSHDYSFNSGAENFGQKDFAKTSKESQPFIMTYYM